LNESVDNYIFVYAFTYPHELTVIRARLESEEIEYLVKDELTAQVMPFYSNAIGGVKLFVKEQYLEKTIEILKESGFYKVDKDNSPSLFSRLDKSTRRFPVIGKMRTEFRIVILLALLFLSVISIFIIKNLPNDYKRLTETNWCVNYIKYGGLRYKPNSIGLKFITDLSCPEGADFKINGDLDLPGFNSFMVSGKWKLNDGKIQIFNTDTFGFVYDRTYDIDFSAGELVLTSDSTEIYCYSSGVSNNIE
jgi:hypothetical protein